MRNASYVQYGADLALADGGHLVFYIFCNGTCGLPVAIVLVELADLFVQGHFFQQVVNPLVNGLRKHRRGQDEQVRQEKKLTHMANVSVVYYLRSFP